jgi:hypothetical protein
MNAGVPFRDREIRARTARVRDGDDVGIVPPSD